MLLACSAAFVGFVHSLAPGHWLPILLVARTRGWSLQLTLFGAVVAGLGHVFLSLVLGLLSFWVEFRYFAAQEELVERYAHIGLIVFGCGYALRAGFRHAHCEGHTHHGPRPSSDRWPFAFLFWTGFSPCVAALPLFIAAAQVGLSQMLGSWVAFTLGVYLALMGAAVIGRNNLNRLDLPILEHYGDVITGASVASMGLILLLI